MPNPNPQLKAAIEACDRAISQEDYATREWSITLMTPLLVVQARHG